MVAAALTGLGATLLALVPGVAHADPAAAPTAPVRYLTTPYATVLTGELCSAATDPQGGPIALDSVGLVPWTFHYDKTTCAFTLTPGTSSGSGSFSYRLTDGVNVSDWLTVQVTIGKQGNAPVVPQPDSLATGKGLKKVVDDLPAVLASNDTDPEGAPLTVSGVVAETGPLPGEDLTNATWISPTTWVYTPPTGFTGSRRFVYSVSDGATTSKQVLTIAVTDQGPLKAPVANPDSYTVPKNGSLVMTGETGVLANDTDADSAYFAVGAVSYPAKGKLTNFKPADGTWTYTPNQDFVGTDSFTYQVIDAEGLTSAYATVTLTVKTMAPVAVDDVLQVAKDGQIVVPFATLTANDTDVDSSFEVSNVLPPGHGAVVASYATKTLTYTPAGGYTGSDLFAYRTVDPDGNYSGWANVAVSVVPPLVNQAPLAANDSYEIHQGDTLSVGAAQGVLANDTDFESQDVDVASHAPAQHGTFTDFDLETGGFTYQPYAGWHGTETVAYTSKDSAGAVSGTATITITVRNDAPVAVDDSYPAFSGVPLVVGAGQGVLVNDTDAEDETLTASSWSIPQHATLSYDNDGSFTLTPAADYTGPVTFWYTVKDQAGQESAPATVTVTVSEAPPGAEEPPVATDVTGLPQAGPIEGATPRIAGKARVGRKLRALVGVWSPAPVALTYQWFRNGKAIKTATKAVYRLKNRDRGKRISVQVTGTRPAYAAVTRVSAAKRVR